MVRLVVADDHIVLREALCEMLRGRKKYEIVAQVATGRELLDVLTRQAADVLIVDLVMPEVDGLEVLSQLRDREDAPPVLVLSANENEDKVRKALQLGARGFVPKQATVDELEFAIDSVLHGKTYLSPAVTASLMTKGPVDTQPGAPFHVLTKREMEILTHLADGKPNRVIGKLLHISTRTVDTHRSNILKKLNVRTNAELVKLAIAHGVVSV